MFQIKISDKKLKEEIEKIVFNYQIANILDLSWLEPKYSLVHGNPVITDREYIKLVLICMMSDIYNQRRYRKWQNEDQLQMYECDFEVEQKRVPVKFRDTYKAEVFWSELSISTNAGQPNTWHLVLNMNFTVEYPDGKGLESGFQLVADIDLDSQKLITVSAMNDNLVVG